MASNKKPASAGAMDVYQQASYYCDNCGCTMNRSVVQEEDGKKVKVMKCMYCKCKHYNIAYEFPLLRAKLYVPQAKKPESPMKQAVTKKTKL